MGILHDSQLSPCRASLLALVGVLGLLVSCSKDATKKAIIKPDADGTEMLEAIDPNPEPEALEEVVVDPQEPRR